MKPSFGLSSMILIAIGLALITSCHSRENVDPRLSEMSHQRGYKDWYLDSFRSGLFVPPSYTSDKKFPLIIFLHGYSDTTTWDLEWYNEPIVSSDPCIVLTPKCPASEIYGWGDSWDPRTSPMMEKTYEMMELVNQALNIDRNRIYIYGISMGGYGTYGAIQKNPDLFAAAYVECGNGNPAIASILADIPLWIFHGSDDPVVPVQGARNMYHAILDAGGTQVRYTEYPGVGHNAWDYAQKETTLQTWLLAQRRGSIHQKPDTLQDFSGTLTNSGRVNLAWKFPSVSGKEDNNIWYTRIFRNDSLITEIYNDRNSYIDSAVTYNAEYNYKASCVNYYFKESDFSAPLAITITSKVR